MWERRDDDGEMRLFGHVDGGDWWEMMIVLGYLDFVWMDSGFCAGQGSEQC